jgi:hypothetical protein
MPAIWKRALGLIKQPKDASVDRAVELYPDWDPAAPVFYGAAKATGRADALLLAHYGRVTPWPVGVVS